MRTGSATNISKQTFAKKNHLMSFYLTENEIENFDYEILLLRRQLNGNPSTFAFFSHMQSANTSAS